tara:strand:- start:1711 stop:2784 length:1074 start_codon:yes stop_codon:yes gene_type:complete
MPTNINLEPINPESDVTTITTELHEVIPLTGTLASGTYGTAGALGNEPNIKNFTHGMFQSVYDYPYLSSSANHIYDLTIGYDSTSALSASSNAQNTKKLNMYNQFSQVLLGYTGSNADNLLKFENDLKLDQVGDLMKECVFISLSRLVTKDEIKRQTFSITLGTGSFAAPFSKTITITDKSASCASDAQVGQGLGGQYGLLYDTTASIDHPAKGVVFYQSGIAVLTASLFTNDTEDFYNDGSDRTVDYAFKSLDISASCDALRHRIKNISFNNTTEINSQIYFCNIKPNKFNYSSNPTYTSGSKIRVKDIATDQPISYITTVGLYDAAGECVAVAKLSEPIRKDPTINLVLRVRLDY